MALLPLEAESPKTRAERLSGRAEDDRRPSPEEKNGRAPDAVAGRRRDRRPPDDLPELGMEPDIASGAIHAGRDPISRLHALRTTCEFRRMAADGPTLGRAYPTTVRRSTRSGSEYGTRLEGGDT